MTINLFSRGSFSASLSVVCALSTFACSDSKDTPTASSQTAGTSSGGNASSGAASSAGGSPSAGAAPAGGGGVGGVAALVTDLPDGFAAVEAPGESASIKGGAGADAAHTYTVMNRNELVRALYPDAVIAPDGSFTSANGADATPKIIYVKGTISLNTNASGFEQTEADYACAGFTDAAYQAAYNPKTWNTKALVKNKPPALPTCVGSLEALRLCSSRKQSAVVRVLVGSNTSLIGLGTDAKVIHGDLFIGKPSADTPIDMTPCGAAGSGAGGTSGSSAGGGAGGGGGTGGAATAGGTGGTGAAGGSSGGATAGGGASGTNPLPPLPAPATNNVIVRNITFEDSFDFFPAWDPTDSFVAPPAVADAAGLYPKCQTAYDAATDKGPQQCPGGRWNSLYDNISVQNAAHVWIDHNTFSDGTRADHNYPTVWSAPYVGIDHHVQHHDGLVDVTGASNYVTLSYNVFKDHDKTNLLGSSDTATIENGFGSLSITVHHNFYSNAGQRCPRVRFGKVHTYDNYHTGQLLPTIKTAADLAKVPSDDPFTYGIGVGYLAKLYSENNVFELTPFPGDPPVTQSSVYFLWHKAAPTSGDTLDVNQQTYFFDAGSTLNGSATDLLTAAQASAVAVKKPALVSTDSVWKPSSSYNYQLTPSAEVKALVTSKAGAGKL